MNNPYEIDMYMDEYDTLYQIDIPMENDRKRKYHELETILRKKITYKKCKYNNNDRFYNPSKKRMYDLQDTFGVFSKIKL